jgi:hypothetical protein
MQSGGDRMRFERCQDVRVPYVIAQSKRIRLTPPASAPILAARLARTQMTPVEKAVDFLWMVNETLTLLHLIWAAP